MSKSSRRARAWRSRNGRAQFSESLESRTLLSASGIEVSPSPAIAASPSAQVASAALENGRLTVEGTSGNDVIIFSEDRHGLVVVIINGQQQGPFAATEIVATGLAGDDVLRTEGKFFIPVEFRGGIGDDTLIGGDADDVLLGESGNDDLDGGNGHDIVSGGEGDDRVVGGRGRDLLIGGDGGDIVRGGRRDDTVIAGQTRHDADVATLKTILANWKARASYANRLAALGDNSSGPALLDALSYLDDQDLDRLFGARGSDWFVGSNGDTARGQSQSEDMLLTDLQSLPVVNRAVVDKPGVQQSPSVAVNPLDPNHVVIAYMDYSLPTADAGLPGEGYAGIGVAVSRDGGYTWEHSAVPLPAGFDQGAAVPIAKFDDQGRLFVSFMAATFLGQLAPLTNADFFNANTMNSDRVFGFQSNNGIFVVRSDDGGLDWSAAAEVSTNLFSGTNVPFDMQPDLAIDTAATLPDGTPNPHYGNMYVAWMRFYAAGEMPGAPQNTGGSDILISVSRDGGQTWETQLKLKEFWVDSNGDQVRQDNEVTTATVTVFDFFFREFAATAGQGFLDQAHLTVGPEGTVYVGLWTGGAFSVLPSFDGGASFSLITLVDEHGNPDARLLPFGLRFDAFPDSAGLPNNSFRTFANRAVGADPSRPGQVYAVDTIPHVDEFGKQIDAADVYFDRTTDHSETWQVDFQVGPHEAQILSDDNDAQIATGTSDQEVISGQAFTRLAVDARGNLGVIWYDTRRDPNDHLLDLFGTLSTDGGNTFTSNFRLTTVSFDADAGSFIDATGAENVNLGDFLGLAMANNTAYAAWTDTRLGSQDIFFTQFEIDAPPPPPNDRFEPNDAPGLQGPPTDLGTVVQKVVPKLSVPVGDEDWFRVTTSATGPLIATALQSSPGTNLQIELWNEAGTTLLATGNAVLDPGGQTVGQRLSFDGRVGETFLVRVTPQGAGEARYSLELQSLTEDLGTRVHGIVEGTFAAGDILLYALKAGAPGELAVKLTEGFDVVGNLHMQLLDPVTLTPLASGQPLGALASGNVDIASLAVAQSQAVLIQITGDAGALGSFTLEFTNLDQFQIPDSSSLVFPAGAGPSQAAFAHLNQDVHLDLVVSNAFSDTLSVLLGNGDGTFQAPRQFAIGAYTPPVGSDNRLPVFRRAIAIADLDHDGVLDILVTNEASADISVLLGRGDGTFETQRRFDAGPGPFSIDVGDINNDTHIDVVVTEAGLGPATVAVLLGRGDGTFQPQTTFQIFSTAANPLPTVELVHLDGDGKLDAIFSGDTGRGVEVYLGNGDGTFTFSGRPDSGREGPDLDLVDVDGDGILDVVVASTHESGEVSVLLGLGNGDFEEQAPNYFAGQAPYAVEVVDFGSAVTLPDGSIGLGPRDGRVDLIVANSGLRPTARLGPAGVVLLPGEFDALGQFVGFGAPIPLFIGDAPTDLDVADVNTDGAVDVAVVYVDGVRILYGQPPVIESNSTKETARDLGAVVHLVQPTLTITPEQQEAWYKLQVPAESTAGAGPQILDFSAGFAFEEGPGLSMEVTDAAGNVLAAGDRFRLVAAQGAELFVRIFGLEAAGERGFGAHTLAINVLPQVVSVESQALLPGVGGLPGGPTTSIVLTFQGDRLDPATAENSDNYRVTWLGADGLPDTGDEQIIPLAATAKPVVYSPSTNVDILTGTRFPTAIHQTVTLLFDQALPAGSYQIDVLPAVQTEDFNLGEDSQLSGGVLDGHPVVQASDAGLAGGATIVATDLVLPAGPLGSFEAFDQGTSFLSQLHDDLAAILDGALTALGDDPNISQQINDHIRERLTAALRDVAAPVDLLAVWLDPGSFEVTDPTGDKIIYDIGDDQLTDGIGGGFVDVIGNLEIIIIAALQGTYDFTVASLGQQPRGGYVLTSSNGTTAQTTITSQLRGGTSSFQIANTPTP